MTVTCPKCNSDDLGIHFRVEAHVNANLTTMAPVEGGTEALAGDWDIEDVLVDWDGPTRVFGIYCRDCDFEYVEGDDGEPGEWINAVLYGVAEDGRPKGPG